VCAVLGSGRGRMLVKPDRAVDSHAHSDCDHRNLHRRPADDQLHCHSVDHHDRRHVHSQLDSALRVRESSPSWSEPVRHASAVKRKLPGAAELARLSDRDWDRQLRGQERRYRYTYSHNSDGQSKGNADACGSANGIAVANVWHDVPSDQEERRRDGVLRELQRERNGIYVSGVVRMLLGTGTPGACRINDITSTFTCTVTATGDGGTASANGTATGINSPPFLGSTPTYSPSAPLPENTVVWANYDANDPDGDGYSCVRTRACGGPCGSIDTCSMVPSLTSQGQVRFDTGSSAGTCCWGVQWTDEWGAITNSPNFSVPVQ